MTEGGEKTSETSVKRVPRPLGQARRRGEGGEWREDIKRREEGA